MRPYIFAVDPGKVTGFAWVMLDPFQISHGEVEQLPFCNLADSWLAAGPGRVHVVCESFTITQQTAKNSPATWSLEIIGVLKYLAHRHEQGAVKLQSPTDAKRFAPNDRLKRVGMYPRGMGHAADAARHALKFMVDNGWRHPDL